LTEFVETAMRHFCRNPKCRSKLPTSVSNPREAFCARGCHTSFYRKRCLVCEQMMDRKTEHQLVCGKRRCRNALQGGFDGGRYHASSNVSSPSKTPGFIDLKTALTPDRARQIAGPVLSTGEFRAATVPDAAGGRWEGGEYRRTEAKNRAALKAAEEAAVEANGQFTEPDWREVVSPDGGRCFVTRFRDQDLDRDRGPVQAQEPPPDDLSIPSFLDCRLRTEPELAA
jgi:hypothetical protein